MEQASHTFLESSTLVWIPLLPLIGAFINLVFGRRMPRWAVYAVSIGAVALACLVAFAHVFGPLLDGTS